MSRSYRARAHSQIQMMLRKKTTFCSTRPECGYSRRCSKSPLAHHTTAFWLHSKSSTSHAICLLNFTNSLNSTHFALGTIDRKEHKYERATRHFHKTMSLWQASGQMASHPLYISCIYRLGCLALNQGDAKTAWQVVPFTSHSFQVA